MLLRYYQVIDLPIGVVEGALLGGECGWIPDIVGRSLEGEDRLLAEVGLGGAIRLRKTVEVTVGRPHWLGATLVVPIAWQASGARGLFPVLDGSLEVFALGSSRTQLGFSASYRPPLDGVGRVADRALLHRVAEATAKDFVDRVAERIVHTAPMTERPTPVPRASGDDWSARTAPRGHGVPQSCPEARGSAALKGTKAVLPVNARRSST